MWDLSSGEVCFGQRVGFPVSVLKWVSQQRVDHYINYQLVLGVGNVMNQV